MRQLSGWPFIFALAADTALKGRHITAFQPSRFFVRRSAFVGFPFISG
jgi:hypothetical protein